MTLRGGRGGVKVNVTMTLRIMILICEQPLTMTIQLYTYEHMKIHCKQL